MAMTRDPRSTPAEGDRFRIGRRVFTCGLTPTEMGGTVVHVQQGGKWRKLHISDFRDLLAEADVVRAD